MNKYSRLMILPIFGLASLVHAVPLQIDLTTQPAPPQAAPYGPGTTKNTQGQEITADQRSFFLNGKPWIPIVGEFHYARYPREEWRDELLKMKAGGINTVSTYVFWIHHEEEKGKWDWSDRRSLRDFLKLVQESGLKAMVRMGPWCHGEVRNGGFPDWVQNSGTKLRKIDPAFLKLVEPLFKEEAKQMQGLLWKDGGPVIGIQLDNECSNADYLLALKELARSVGVDVPLYTITGWQGGLPKADLMPLFGGYVDGFWGGSHEEYRREFMFTDVRAVNDLGAQLTTRDPVNFQLIARFPYACAEIGGGMASAYDRRIHLDPASIAALSLTKLGDGNNMPGYYMFQGGTNPDGALTHLNEDHPNRLPVKDYDFQAPLGSAGQVREQYHLLRKQHLFLQDFGATLARMPAYFPEQRPANLKDFDTLRWSMRSDGKSGFLFFSNQQPYEPLPEHKDVQFEVKMSAGSLSIPQQPVNIPTGSYGIWPVNFDCAGVVLKYATAQLLCGVKTDKATVFFFAALDGIEPELLLRAVPGRVNVVGAEKAQAGDAVRVFHIKQGTAPAAGVVNPDGSGVSFVILTPEQSRQLYRVTMAGVDRVLLSKAAVFADGNVVRLQKSEPGEMSVAFFPPVPAVKIDGTDVRGVMDGIFARFNNPSRGPAEIPVMVTQEKPAGSIAASLKGADESTWNDAAVYSLNLITPGAGHRRILNINYCGDAARLYVGDKLFNDNYYNGDPFSIALWRIPVSDWSKIRVRVLPYSDGLMGRLPDGARKIVEQAKQNSKLDQVSVRAVDQFEQTLSLPTTIAR